VVKPFHLFYGLKHALRVPQAYAIGWVDIGIGTKRQRRIVVSLAIVYGMGNSKKRFLYRSTFIAEVIDFLDHPLYNRVSRFRNYNGMT
jgi:hypothetical protein